MSKKIKLKDKENSPSLFNHNLIKTIVLYQLAQKGMAWEAFLEIALKWHEENAASQSPSVPKQQTEVGSSSKIMEKNQLPKLEVTKVYKKGQRLVFSSHGDKGTEPSSSTKQEPAAKEKDIVEHEFELVDLESEDQTSNM